MKIQYYFIAFFVIILMVVSAYISNQYTTKQMQKKFDSEAKLTLAEKNALIEELNTVTLKGEGDQSLLAEIKKQLKESDLLNKKLNLDITQMYQDPDADIHAWDWFEDFIPDTTGPEIVEVIKEVIKEVDVVDSTVYSYSDKQNAYYFDLKIKYASKGGLFSCSPENLKFEPVKQRKWKRTNISAVYFANNSGGMLIQYDIFKFLNLGGFVGISSDKPLTGISMGFEF